jgi:hypothetical protein
MAHDQETLQRIRAADIIFAQSQGGKLDGKIIPVWISARVSSQLNNYPSDSEILANVFRIVIAEPAAAFILSEKVAAVKGPSSHWPESLVIEAGSNGIYRAAFRKR